ncbi:trace amine-associated receptor 13c-like [Anabas testudineus]|uniref:trace amine-associated receptor 13c-like n=1 Tax=Anabas testudineus TaxID=64144 RepID=UPI000E45DCF8|nr:trace amine-associated receptor 13c-like [Anabas testudineus]
MTLNLLLHTPTNLILLSLAVSDFFVGLLWLFQMMIIDGCWLLGDLMCILYFAFDYIITSTSVRTMVLISVDRYVAICDPLHYSTKVTPRRIGVCVSLCWISSVFYRSVLITDDLKQPGRYNLCAGQCVVAITFIDQISNLIVTFFIPITVIVVLYLRVFVVAVSQARAMRSHIMLVSHQRSVSVTAKKSEMKAAGTLGLVIVVFLLCMFPYFNIALRDQSTLLSASSAGFTIYLAHFNSCLNPMIYAFFYPWFRKSFRLIVTLKILKPGS